MRALTGILAAVLVTAGGVVAGLADLQLPTEPVHKGSPPAIDPAASGPARSGPAPAAIPTPVHPVDLASALDPLPQCAATRITVVLGDAPSPATGQHGFALDLTNRGNTPCWLRGRPALQFADADGEPSRLQENEAGKGAEYVHGYPDDRVLLQPGGTAHVFVAKYRCDLSPETSATNVTVRLPGAGEVTKLPLSPASVVGVMDWCGDPQDTAGRTYAITPFQPGTAP